MESLTLGGLVRVNRLRRADSVHTGSQLHSLSPAATHQRCQLAYQLSLKPSRAAASLASQQWLLWSDYAISFPGG